MCQNRMRKFIKEKENGKTRDGYTHKILIIHTYVCTYIKKGLVSIFIQII